MSLGKVGGAVTWQGWVRPIGAAHHISTTRPILCSGCDNCNEWFHGDCIRITEKMAKAIREWYCRECQEKDPKLEIRYRLKKSRERDSNERDGSEPRDEGGGRKRPAPDPDLQRRAGSGTGVGAILARGSASPHKSSPQPLGATPSQVSGCGCRDR